MQTTIYRTARCQHVARGSPAPCPAHLRRPCPLRRDVTGSSSSPDATGPTQQALQDEVSRLQRELATTRQQLAASEARASAACAKASGGAAGGFGPAITSLKMAVYGGAAAYDLDHPTAVGYSFWCAASGGDGTLVRTSSETVHAIWPELEEPARLGQPQRVTIYTSLATLREAATEGGGSGAAAAAAAASASSEKAYDVEICCLGVRWRLSGAQPLFEDLGVARPNGLLRLFLQPDGRVFAYPVPCPR